MQKKYSYNQYGQRLRLKIPPPAAKRCRVVYAPNKTAMYYDPEQKMLMFPSDGFQPTIFPAKSKAQTAIWMTVQNSGGYYGYAEFVIEEI